MRIEEGNKSQSRFKLKSAITRAYPCFIFRKVTKHLLEQNHAEQRRRIKINRLPCRGLFLRPVNIVAELRIESFDVQTQHAVDTQLA